MCSSDLLGLTTLISNYSEYYRLTSYFRRYTKEMIGVTMGINNLLEIFNEKYYEHLEGGILESFGRLFRNRLRLYVYPLREPGNTQLVHVHNLPVEPKLRHLYDHLVHNGCIAPLEGYDESVLHIFSPDVLAKIASCDASWQAMVPEGVARVIREQRLFGHGTRVLESA